VRIMRRCDHRSSWRYARASRTFARYPAGMAKARLRKPDGRKSKAPADDMIARDDGLMLPAKKPAGTEREAPWNATAPQG
jgi:hypothetical protein